jgi:3alpha(or 20beta)-hydroxysteroid dehydrogenase
VIWLGVAPSLWAIRTSGESGLASLPAASGYQGIKAIPAPAHISISRSDDLSSELTQEGDWKRVVDAAEKLGGLHGLVNNAGIYQPRALMETETELFERHTRVNQLDCFLGMKAVVRLMEQSGGGSIVNISSVARLRGSPGAIAYSATKWALRGMTKAAAIDLAPRKIRVNSVHPGPIDTEMIKVRTPEQNRQRMQLVPMKRIGTVDEVASLVLFLLSDESGYITGAEVAIDGGVSL